MEIRWLELEQLFWTVKWKLCAKDGGGGRTERTKIPEDLVKWGRKEALT